MTQLHGSVNTGIEISKLFELIEANQGLLPALQLMVNALIEAELINKIGADRHERTEKRINLRNGSRKRKKPLKTGIGPVDINIPKLRKGSFYPTILERYQRIDRALIGVIQEAYIQGVSTRSMERVFKDLRLTGLDKSTISRLIQPIKAEVENWRKRSLNREYIYIWMDALYVKLRHEGIVRSVAVLIAIGLQKDGHRDVLGLRLGNRESYENWKAFFQELKSRELAAACLWISDDHDGLLKAFRECFPGQLHQRCIVHWERNALMKLSKGYQEQLVSLLKPLVNATTRRSFEIAEEELLQSVEEWGKDDLLEWLEDSLPDIKTYLIFPTGHYRHIKSTNPLERLNQEIRRRERVVRIFPNEGSCELLIGAILKQQSDEWLTGRRYIVRELKAALAIGVKNGVIISPRKEGKGKEKRTAASRPAPLPPLRRAGSLDAPMTFTPTFET